MHYRALQGGTTQCEGGTPYCKRGVRRSAEDTPKCRGYAPMHSTVVTPSTTIRHHDHCWF